MDIGGKDVVVETNKGPKEAINIAMEQLLSEWPEMVWEDISDGEFDDLIEYFFYKNQKAKEEWDKDVPNETDEPDMVYILAEDGRVTLVVEDDYDTTNLETVLKI